MKTLFVGALNDLRRKRGSWTVGTEAVEIFEIVCEFSNLVVVDVSEIFRDVTLTGRLVLAKKTLSMKALSEHVLQYGKC